MDQTTLYELNLDFAKEMNYSKAVLARQGDKGITITVNGYLHGLPMIADENGFFTLKATTPTGLYVDASTVSVTGNSMVFQLDGSFLVESGYYQRCYVEYRTPDSVYTTQDIILYATKSSDPSAGEAKAYISQLEKLIELYNQTFDDFMKEIQGDIDVLNGKLTDINNQAKAMKTQLDDLKKQIENLGKLSVRYSNSVDFGDYDYSGNPNLLVPINFSKLSSSQSSITTPPKYVKDYGQYFELDGSDPDNLDKDKNVVIPLLTRLIKGKTYTISVSMMIDDNFSLGNSAFYYIVWTGKPTVTYDRLVNVTPDEGSRNAWKVYTKTFTIPSDQKDGDTAPFLHLYFPPLQKGKLKVGYDIKLEEGSKATPYQPNLLDAPYYLSKVPLGENIIKPESQQPVTNSNYLINTYNTKPMIRGKKYTITLEGTKPATQTFRPFFTRATGASWSFGDLQPVEGLTNVWSKTFIAADDSHPTNPQVQIYQVPNTSLGQCTIKWIKLEEGDTRTPNIDQFKYKGLGILDTNNPHSYEWDLSPDYVETNDAKVLRQAKEYTDDLSQVVTRHSDEITAIQTKKVKYRGIYGTGNTVNATPSKARLPFGEIVGTAETILNQPMESDPFEWNSERWEATVLRDCTIKLDATVLVEANSNLKSSYIYLQVWSNSDQTGIRMESAGMGLGNNGTYWFRNLMNISKIFTLQAGSKFSLGVEFAGGTLGKALINCADIQEL